MEENLHVKVLKMEEPSKKIKLEKEKEKRVITKTNKWKFNISDYLFENQYEMIERLINSKDMVDTDPLLKCVLQEINKKIYGYKSQDMLKHIYDEDAFVNIDYVLSLLHSSKMECFYCKEKVNIIYESVREPKQWSLERIDNTMGHNNNNVEIACLNCNLRRRTMYHERYRFTKQMGIITKLG